MKTNDRAIRRRVLRDSWRAMRVPVLFHAVADALGSTLLVETADVLGRFAESALALDWSGGQKSAAALALCVVLTIVTEPALKLLGRRSMLKQALAHEKIVFSRFFDKSPEAVRALDSGELRNELEDAPNHMRKEMVTALEYLLSVPFCLGYLLWRAGGTDWLLTGVMLALAAARVVVPALLRKPMMKCYREEDRYEDARRSRETDVTGAPYLLPLWGISAPVLRRFYRLFERYYKQSGARLDALGAVDEQSGALMGPLTKVLLFVLGAALAARGRVSAGGLIAALVYLDAAETIFSRVASFLRNYPKMLVDADRVADFYRDPEQPKEQKAEGFTALRAKDIRLSFDGTQVLRGVNFVINPGDKVAVVGENGSGKSTLGRVMATLLTGYTGEVTVNGTELRALDAASWRGRLAYAPQDAFLFSATVRENVLMGNPDADKETVQAMLEAFGVAALADRELTGDSDLSGGERQKISILRALIKDADVLLLDEPTNHLDRDSIAWLTEYLKHTERTVIVISHDEALTSAMARTVEL